MSAIELQTRSGQRKALANLSNTVNSFGNRGTEAELIASRETSSLEAATSADLLLAILIQLNKTNAYLAELVGSELNDEDITI